LSENQKKEFLFQSGIKSFKSKEYFQAHEEWENLWSDYYLEDRKFVQGLIQLSVSFFHLQNRNLKGAKSMLNKSQEKFKLFKDLQRGISIEKLLFQIERVSVEYNKIETALDFNWQLVPTLE
jgi:hypothetical protein